MNSNQKEEKKTGVKIEAPTNSVANLKSIFEQKIKQQSNLKEMVKPNSRISNVRGQNFRQSQIITSPLNLDGKDFDKEMERRLTLMADKDPSESQAESSDAQQLEPRASVGLPPMGRRRGVVTKKPPPGNEGKPPAGDISSKQQETQQKFMESIRKAQVNRKSNFQENKLGSPYAENALSVNSNNSRDGSQGRSALNSGRVQYEYVPIKENIFLKKDAEKKIQPKRNESGNQRLSERKSYDQSPFSGSGSVEGGSIKSITDYQQRTRQRNSNNKDSKDGDDAYETPQSAYQQSKNQVIKDDYKPLNFAKLTSNHSSGNNSARVTIKPRGSVDPNDLNSYQASDQAITLNFKNNPSLTNTFNKGRATVDDAYVEPFDNSSSNILKGNHVDYSDNHRSTNFFIKRDSQKRSSEKGLSQPGDNESDDRYKGREDIVNRLNQMHNFPQEDDDQLDDMDDQFAQLMDSREINRRTQRNGITIKRGPVKIEENNDDDHKRASEVKELNVSKDNNLKHQKGPQHSHKNLRSLNEKSENYKDEEEDDEDYDPFEANFKQIQEIQNDRMTQRRGENTIASKRRLFQEQQESETKEVHNINRKMSDHDNSQSSIDNNPLNSKQIKENLLEEEEEDYQFEKSRSEVVTQREEKSFRNSHLSKYHSKQVISEHIETENESMINPSDHDLLNEIMYGRDSMLKSTVIQQNIEDERDSDNQEEPFAKESQAEKIDNDFENPFANHQDNHAKKVRENNRVSKVINYEHKESQEKQNDNKEAWNQEEFDNDFENAFANQESRFTKKRGFTNAASQQNDYEESSQSSDGQKSDSDSYKEESKDMQQDQKEKISNDHVSNQDESKVEEQNQRQDKTSDQNLENSFEEKSRSRISSKNNHSDKQVDNNQEFDDDFENAFANIEARHTQKIRGITNVTGSDDQVEDQNDRQEQENESKSEQYEHKQEKQDHGQESNHEQQEFDDDFENAFANQEMRFTQKRGFTNAQNEKPDESEERDEKSNDRSRNSKTFSHKSEEQKQEQDDFNPLNQVLEQTHNNRLSQDSSEHQIDKESQKQDSSQEPSKQHDNHQIEATSEYDDLFEQNFDLQSSVRLVQRRGITIDHEKIKIPQGHKKSQKLTEEQVFAYNQSQRQEEYMVNEKQSQGRFNQQQSEEPSDQEEAHVQDQNYDHDYNHQKSENSELSQKAGEEEDDDEPDFFKQLEKRSEKKGCVESPRSGKKDHENLQSELESPDHKTSTTPPDMEFSTPIRQSEKIVENAEKLQTSEQRTVFLREQITQDILKKDVEKKLDVLQKFEQGKTNVYDQIMYQFVFKNYTSIYGLRMNKGNSAAAAGPPNRR